MMSGYYFLSSRTANLLVFEMCRVRLSEISYASTLHEQRFQPLCQTSLPLIFLNVYSVENVIDELGFQGLSYETFN